MGKELNSSGDPIRFNKAERFQHEFRDICLDELVGEDHPVRLVWQYVCSLDLSAFYLRYKAVSGKAGRKPVDPRILLTLWLCATIGKKETLEKLLIAAEKQVDEVLNVDADNSATKKRQ